MCRQFVDLELERIKNGYGYDAEASGAAFELMLRLGTDLALGARPTRAAVAKLLGDAVTVAQLRGLPKGCCVFERSQQGEFLKLLVKELVPASTQCSTHVSTNC
jgi:ATP-dependent Clp protease ATP-binding subunit ClpA